MHTHKHTYIQAHINTYIHTYTYIHAYTHIHTHIYSYTDTYRNIRTPTDEHTHSKHTQTHPIRHNIPSRFQNKVSVPEASQLLQRTR